MDFCLKFQIQTETFVFSEEKMATYRECDEFWLNLATSRLEHLDQNKNVTARIYQEDVKKINSKDFQQYLDAHPYCVTGPAIIADSDDESITSSGNSDASCCNDEIKQLEVQLLQLWKDKVSPSSCRENMCKENEILRGKLTKLEEIVSILKSTIFTQLEIIAKQVEEK